MIDWIRCSCSGVDAMRWQNDKRMDFHADVSLSTGKQLTRSEAQYNGLRFIVPTATGLASTLMGSLHQNKNSDRNNWDDFTYEELKTTLTKIQDDYGISLPDAVIHSIEIGVNLRLNYPAQRILQAAICHNRKPFTHMNRNDRKMGVVCGHTEMDIKLYDKAHQYRLPGVHILRYEVRVKRMRVIETYDIKTLADLLDGEKVARLVGLLLEQLSRIIFFDFGCSTDGMTVFQRIQWERFSNPNYWENLNKRMAYKARKQYEEAIKRHGAEHIAETLFISVSTKWTDLMDFKRKNGRLFHQFFEYVKACDWWTFSHLECRVIWSTMDTENIERELEGKKEAKMRTQKMRFCVICGRDISHQKKGSRFCSERDFGKEAKRCLNKDSNRRMIIKRKIKNAKMKDYFLRITYTDADGTSYTDMLTASEVSPTREWLDRVTSVEVCKEPPETLTGNEAKEFLTKNLK